MECFVIFVLAWCWIYATIFKPRNVKCNIFSELTPKTSLLFFHLKILKFVAEKSCVTIETRTELCVEIRCVKICCAWQTKFTWYLKPENQTLSINVAFSFFKFRKYNTAFNSGLKIWLVSGIFWNGAVAQFKVLCIFVLAWCWVFATFLSRETLNAIYFPNLRWTLRSYFSVWYF